MASRAPGQKKDAPTRGRKQRREEARRAARRRQLINRLSWGGGLALVVGAVLALVLVGQESGNVEPAAWDLPAMGPTAEAGRDRVRLADFEGSPTVVNFFASWCEECDRELPGFRAVSEELSDQIDFVGIASQETGDPMFMPNRHGVTDWVLARDINGLNGSGLSRALGARGMPLTAFYDASGEMLHVQLGTLLEPQLRSTIETLFGIEATPA